jgi:hypothetical protein
VKPKTKIRLAAVAVTLNAVVAIVAMSPKSAVATTCNPVHDCLLLPGCPTQGAVNALCTRATPPGCTYKSGTCTLNPLICGSQDPAFLVCQYQ